MKLQHVAVTLAALLGLSAPARAQKPRTPVAAHDLARGAILTVADIAWSDSVRAPEWTRENGMQVTAGWVVRRNIRQGEALVAPSVSQPDLVTSGTPVDVVYSVPGVSIKVRGTAVGSGGLGDEVYVRLDNRKRLRGTVAGANTVRVM